YWRYPGDAGVPPRFDFTGSQNVGSVEVLWPAPQPIPEQGLTAIGYRSDVTLPLVVAPQNPGRPVTLKVKVGYTVCEKLCVTAEGKAMLAVSGGPSPNDAALAAAEARVPKKRALGQGGALAVTSLRREDTPKGARIIVDVTTPSDAALFVEGPTPDWALPVPVPVAGAPAGMQRFVFDLDGAPPGAAYAGAAVTFTVVAGDSAIEVSTRLD